MAEETIKFNVEYDIRNVDQTVRQTQRVLYAMNSIRLSIVDFQRLMEKPTLENAMWLAINLTQTWRAIVRLINAANAASSTGNLVNLLGGGVGGGIGGAVKSGAGATLKGAVTSTAAGTFTSSLSGATGYTSTGGAYSGVSAYFGYKPLATTAAKSTLMQTVIGLAMAHPIITTAVVAGLAVGGIIWMHNEELNNYKDRQWQIARSQGLEY